MFFLDVERSITNSMQHVPSLELNISTNMHKPPSPPTFMRTESLLPFHEGPRFRFVLKQVLYMQSTPSHTI